MLIKSFSNVTILSRASKITKYADISCGSNSVVELLCLCYTEKFTECSGEGWGGEGREKEGRGKAGRRGWQQSCRIVKVEVLASDWLGDQN